MTARIIKADFAREHSRSPIPTPVRPRWNWQAWQLRYADMDRAVIARASAASIRDRRGRRVPEHRAIPTLSPGVCTCVRCGKPVRTAGPNGFGAVHAQVG